MAKIPDELIVEILVLLPVDSLLRCRCVSKKWRNLIDSPDFVKLHSQKSDPVVIFYENPSAYYVELHSVCKSRSPPVLKEVTKPWPGDDRGLILVVGACNGLLCVYDISLDVFLWNPSTRKHVHIPVPLTLAAGMGFSSSWGFCYDSSSGDYKVVNIAQSPSIWGTDLWIYSLKRGMWERFSGFPDFLMHYRRRGLFVNGALHWISHRQISHTSIDVIDLSNMQYRVLPLPDLIDGMESYLEVLNGCLYAISVSFNCVDLWVMKEYGVNDSWTKLLSYDGLFHGLRPLAYTNRNGNELLFNTDSSDLVVYELETGLFKTIGHWSSSYLGKALVYTPSLVDPLSVLQERYRRLP